MNYTESSLYKKAFDDAENNSQVRRLRDQFEHFRTNMAYILNKIREEQPTLTLHNYEHIDELWYISSLIVGDGHVYCPPYFRPFAKCERYKVLFF